MIYLWIGTSVVWLGILAYVASLANQQKKLGRQLKDLEDL